MKCIRSKMMNYKTLQTKTLLIYMPFSTIFESNVLEDVERVKKKSHEICVHKLTTPSLKILMTVFHVHVHSILHAFQDLSNE